MIKYPNRVQEDAGNQPPAATAYDLSGTAETGFQTFSAELADGDECIVLAEEVDANGNPAGAWEITECAYNDLATDTLTRSTLVESSTGSAIDWSATGVNATPRLSIVSTGGGALRRVTTTDASAASSVDFTDLVANKNYFITFNELDFSNDAVGLIIRTSTDNGSTFDSGASDYSWHTRYNSTATVAGTGSASAAGIYPFSTNLIGNANDEEEVDGFFWLLNPNNSGSYTRINGQMHTSTSASVPFSIAFAGARMAAQAVNAIRLLPSAGTFSGKITLYEVDA